MKLLRFVRHDLIEGTLHSWYKFLLVVIVIGSQMVTFHGRLAMALTQGAIYSEATFMDYLMYVIKGMPVYIFDPETTFTIPIYWFAFQIGIAYIIAYYPEKDFKSYGKQMLLASKSRSSWWLSKCIWCVLNVVLYFMLALVTCFVIAKLYGANHTLTYSDDIATTFFNSNAKYIMQSEIQMLVIWLPLVTTIAISLVQVLLSFALSPVLSFAGTCAMYVISAYYTNAFWIGNYTMWQRSTYVDIEGVNPEIGFLMAGILILGSVLIGNIYFDKANVF